MIEITEYPPISVKDFFEESTTLLGKPLKVYDYQEKLFNCKSDFRIINKARQIGISTAIAMEALYYAIWYDHQTILLVSTGDRASRELMDKIRSILFSMKERFTLEAGGQKVSNELEVDTKTMLQFKNESRIFSLPNNPDTIVGFRAHRVYIDEYAHIENSQDIWTSILPSISRGGKLTIISTPKGKLGEFYRLWNESVQGKNDFVRLLIPYTDVTDLEYKDKIEENKKLMTEIQFNQEYCCEFIDENISMFPYELLNPCIMDVDSIFQIKTANPIYLGIDFGNLRSSTVIIIAEKLENKWIIRPPIKEFLGKKRTEGEAAESDFKPQLDYIKEAIVKIRPTRVFVDSTGYGLPLLDELRRSFGGLIVGTTFSNPLKENLITNLRVLFENRQIEIPKNDNLIDQLHGLEKMVTRGSEFVRYKHSYGKFDDYVWALCLAISPQTSKGGIFKVIARKM